MFLRMPMSRRVLSAFAVVLAFAGAGRCDDPATVKQLQDIVTKLEKKIADLEAKVAALEKQTKAVPATTDKDEETYVKSIAGATLDGLLAGDDAALKGKMTQKLLKGIDTFWDVGSIQHDGKVSTWIKTWNAEKKFKTYAIDKVAMSPNKEEAIIQGSLTGKDEANKGTFTMTLAKDKGGKYLLDACSVKAK